MTGNPVISSENANLEECAKTYVQFYFNEHTILVDMLLASADEPVLDFYTADFKTLEELNYKAVYPATIIALRPSENPDDNPPNVHWCRSFEIAPEDGDKVHEPVFSLTREQVLEANLTDAETLYDYSAYMSNHLTAGKALSDLLDNFKTHDHSDFEDFRDTHLYSRKNRHITKW